jgi:hypothetical protein
LNTALLLIGSGCLVCLLPLALYLLFLAFLNNRPRPTLLSGRWDLTCMLLGLSGFILVGGPVLLSAFDSTWRAIIFEGNFAHARSQLRDEPATWSILAAIYVLGMATAIILMMRARQRVSVIYNLGSDVDVLVARALDRLGLRWRKQFGAYEVLPPQASGDTKEAADSDGKPLPAYREDAAFFRASQLEVDPFPAMSHVTLRWYEADPAMRRVVESELLKLLDHTPSPPNPAGSWFLTGSLMLFFVMLVWTGVLVFWMVRTPPGP